MWVEQHGKKWRIRDERGGKKITIAGGYLNKTAAKTAMTRHIGDLQRGDVLIPRGGQTLLSTFVDSWWPHYRTSLKPSSAHSEGARIRNHIVALLGQYSLDDLDTTVVQRWVADLAAGVGPMGPPTRSKTPVKRRPLASKTIHNCHGMLYVILNAAIADRLMRINPCGATNLPHREHREMRFLTDPEIGRLIAAVPKHWRPLVLLLVATGLRWGEAIGLRVGRVDLLAARPKLLVVEQLQEMPATCELVFVSPKSVRSRRTVSFTKQVALALAPLVAGKEPDEMVFLSPGGQMVRTRNFRRGWLKWTKRAGLEGLRIHDLRHTHAALLIAANRQMSAISRRLGHSSITVTDTLYGHLREEVDDGILAAIDASLAGVAGDDVAEEIAAELAEL